MRARGLKVSLSPCFSGVTVLLRFVVQYLRELLLPSGAARPMVARHVGQTWMDALLWQCTDETTISHVPLYSDSLSVKQTAAHRAWKRLVFFHDWIQTPLLVQPRCLSLFQWLHFEPLPHSKH